MRKKGFTLIEIIVCIALISVIGVGSFIGIKIVDKKILKDKLDQITDQAIQAAQIYLETNNEAYNQLYNNQNGVSLPLKLLVNEGLLDISNTKLDDSDLENQYVVTFLGGSGSSENCEQITTTTSWSNNQPIYLCMKSDGTSNLATIDPSKYSNRTKAIQEPYYFKGAGVHNYVKYGDNMYRIYYIDTDDTHVLYSDSSFGTTFQGKTLPITNYRVKAGESALDSVSCNSVDNIPRIGEQYGEVKKEGETNINVFDVVKTSYCTYSNNHYEDILDAWMHFKWISCANYSRCIEVYSQSYKIHLNSSFKLGSGTGDYANPYILEEK